jgi:predicted RNA-binding Zn-ribbon protein involved in translation (DUF1610 family)
MGKLDIHDIARQLQATLQCEKCGGPVFIDDVDYYFADFACLYCGKRLYMRKDKKGEWIETKKAKPIVGRTRIGRQKIRESGV